MTFAHSCFVSYRHSDRDRTRKFIAELVDALDDCTDQTMPISAFHDAARLKAGFKFNLAITKALKESVCLIAVLSPEYFQSDYCRREYMGMIEIEAMRREKTGLPAQEKGLIIPILVWGGDDDVPEEVRNHVHYAKMSYGLTNQRNELKYDPNWADFLEEIAEQIFSHYKDFSQAKITKKAVDCCNAFQLPELVDIGYWDKNVEKSAPPLPGRKRKDGKNSKVTR